MSTKTLGRFEIIREIGKGAMGVVYLAHDPKIDRKIAIKMISIPSGVSDDEARESRQRFVREAQAAGKLTHPNIITIYDVVDEHDTSYIAMEYIEGATLEAHTKPGALLPLDRVLPILAQACAALDYAHKNEVIHRDIKPANLMLMQDDLLKITDFGLAKSPQANLTQAGILIGTPNYMSPEQISGKPMDGRSDIFSLGVVLYELLTGERPFSGDTISTIIYRILYEEPRPPRILNNKLPPAFDGIIKKALAKEPSDRFQTGAEFVEALNNYSTYHLKMPLKTSPPTVRVAREGASPGPVSRDRTEPRLRPVPRPRMPLFAGQPLKIAAFALIFILAVLLFPRRIHDPGKDQVAGRFGVPAASPPQSEASFGMPPMGPQTTIGPRAGAGRSSSPAAVPSGIQAEILVPSGTTQLFLDNQRLNDPVVRFSETDEGEHTLLAQDGCREAKRLIRGSTLTRRIDMKELKPVVADLRIDSKPAQSQVFMDDKFLGETPHTVKDYDSCAPHTFTLRKDNYKDSYWSSDGTKTWTEIAGTLGSATLSEIPPGFAKFETLPSYPIEVYNGKNSVPLQDGKVILPEGTHSLTLRSPKVRFTSAPRKVEITGAKTTSLKITWPGLGSLTIQAEPSNCKIYVDGEFLDFPPINGYSIVAGEHEVMMVPDNDASQTKKKTVVIEAGATTVEKFTFSP